MLLNYIISGQKGRLFPRAAFRFRDSRHIPDPVRSGIINQPYMIHNRLKNKVSDPAKELFEAGLARLGRGEMLEALPLFEKSFWMDPSNNICLSYMALLDGLERGQVQKSIALAREAVARSPEIPILYVNLGKLYYKAGKKEDALEALRQGRKNGSVPEAQALLNEINPRMKPLFPFLARGNFLNKCAGKILKKTGFGWLRMPAQKNNAIKLPILARRGW